MDTHYLFNVPPYLSSVKQLIYSDIGKIQFDTLNQCYLNYEKLNECIIEGSLKTGKFQACFKTTNVANSCAQKR